MTEIQLCSFTRIKDSPGESANIKKNKNKTVYWKCIGALETTLMHDTSECVHVMHKTDVQRGKLGYDVINCDKERSARIG